MKKNLFFIGLNYSYTAHSILGILFFSLTQLMYFTNSRIMPVFRWNIMLHLQELAKQTQHTKELTVNERLPAFLSAPCHLSVSYQVEAKDNFYLIHLGVRGELTIICQRCMEEFLFPYDNHTIIAVCKNDDRAEQLLAHYECIVSASGEVALEDLVIDELHLYVPIFHSAIKDCDSEINQILSPQNETF